ncbi:MAG: FMN-binding protein [Treponema sp.]|nr:FMN-binding protein [Treponema sp.]
MTKKLLTLLAGAAAISLLLAACFVEYDPADVPQGEPMGTYSGTETGSNQGYGGPVTVTLTLAAGYITGVDIDGKQETPAIGGQLIKRAPALIINANSLDAISSASAAFTRDGIIKAGRKALYKITDGDFGSEDGSK